jgi:general L-amino acid transport system permease protein
MSAAAQVFQLVPSRPPPVATEGVLPWLRRNLFSDWKNTLGTVVVLALLARYLPPLLDWAVLNAVARPDNAACRELGHAGACWGVVAEKYRLILFGRIMPLWIRFLWMNWALFGMNIKLATPNMILKL